MTETKIQLLFQNEVHCNSGYSLNLNKNISIILLYFSVFVLILIVKLVLGGVCPPANHIEPCTCTNVTIDCSTGKDLDLGMVFQAIAQGKQINSEDLAFETFVLNNSKIDKLEDSVFQGVIFNTIRLQDCHQLTCVSSSAFNQLEKNLTTFVAIGTSFRWEDNCFHQIYQNLCKSLNRSDDKDCNVFDALKMLYNLETINITKSQISEIPANAFAGKLGSLKALKTIDLSGGEGGNITTVGKSAFSTLDGKQSCASST